MVSKDEPIQNVTISWDSCVPVPSSNEKIFLWQAVDNFFGNSDFIVDDKTTKILRIPENPPVWKAPVRFLELFAGGIAGWSSAIALIRDHHHQPVQVVAIEHDLTCAKGYSIGHHATLIDGFHAPSVDRFVTHAEDHVIHGDVWDKTWLPSITYWNPDVAAVSSPCQPWSSASTGPGLDSRDGLLLAESIGLMKLIRPRILLLEQVGGFASHSHKKLLMRQLRWAGFIVKWERSIDLQAVAPVKRIRWLALAIRAHDESICFDRFQIWVPKDDLTPQGHQAVIQGEAAKDSRLQLSQQVLNMAKDVQLLPPAKRKRLTPDQVLLSRCTSPTEIVSCFMASYGSQHEIRRALLEEKGLYVHFFHDPASQDPPRMWHPVEALCLHSIYGSQYLPHDWADTWKIIGNHIAVPHALVLIVNAINCMPQTCAPMDLDEVLNTLDAQRWKIDDLYTIQLAEGMLVTQSTGHRITTIHELSFAEHTVDDAMPPGQCWSVENGFWTPESSLETHSVQSSLPNAQEDPEVISVTPGSCATTEPAMSETQVFMPLLKGQIVIGTKTMEFWFAADVSMDTVLSVWDHFFMIDPHESPQEPVALRLVPATGELAEGASPQQVARNHALCLYMNDQLTIYADDEHSMRIATNHAQISLFDQFGEVPDLPKKTNLVMTPYNHFSSHDAQMPAPQMTVAAARECFVDTMTTIAGELCLLIKGPQVERTTCAQFWQHVLAPDVLQSLALRIQVEEHDEEVRICFSHIGTMAAYPTPALRVLLMTNAFRYMFEPMRVVQGQQPCKLVRIRWMSRTLWRGYLADDCSLQVSITCQTLSCMYYRPSTPPALRDFRIVSIGKMLSPDFVVGECPFNPGKEECVWNFIPACHGGGPPTAKQGQMIQIKNSLAGSLLQEGFELEWVSKTLDEVVKKVGPRELLPITSMPQGISRMKEIIAIIKQTGITIPEQHAKLTSKASLQHKQKKRTMPPSPKNYVIQDGSLLFQDDSVAVQLKEFAVHHRGFYLAGHDEAVQWIRANTTVASDELALIVFGSPGWETSLAHVQTTLPCYDEHMRPVLAAVTIYQLGQTHIKIKQWDDQKVDTPQSTLVALTLWKEDWLDQWTQIVENPFGFIRSHLNLGDSITAMWGRSFRSGKQATSAVTAQSLQVHCSVKEDDLGKLLRESGHNNVWATPKLSSGKPSDRWKMIWLDNGVTLAEAKIQAAKLPQACGLGRSGSKFAIRVAKVAFTSSWKLIHPDTPEPEDIPTDHLYKLEHLPFGTTALAVSQWADHLGWKVKPIRALGPRGWLVGSPSHPGAEQLAFNGIPVLTRPVRPRQTHYADPILAGPKPTPKSVGKSGAVLAPLIGDPWAGYQGIKPQTTPVQASQAAGPSSTGPIEQRLQLQEDRLSKIEESIARGQHHVQDIQKDIEAKDIAMKSHVDQQLHALRNEIDSGFTRALQQQANKFDTSLNEIKQLLIQSQSKRKTPAEGDDEM
eukprot:Skav206912  [mRNA]  locus=scaffold808:371929:376347:+ [translate_table: standard]